MRAGSREGRAVGTRAERGVGLVWLLAVVAIAGVGLAAIGTVWATDAQRERERQLVRIGTEYAYAIASYYYASPITRREYPRNLEALVEDTRGPAVRRHLRKVYGDPVSGEGPWGLVQQRDGSIIGVYSLSTAQPLRREGFEVGGLQMPAADRYQDWKFIAKVGP